MYIFLVSGFSPGRTSLNCCPSKIMNWSKSLASIHQKKHLIYTVATSKGRRRDETEDLETIGQTLKYNH